MEAVAVCEYSRTRVGTAFNSFFSRLKRLPSVYKKINRSEKHLYILLELLVLDIVVRALLKEELMSGLAIMIECGNSLLIETPR
jgi:hypothetical protein